MEGIEEVKQRNIKAVDARTLQSKLTSKYDWYTFLKFHQGFCLPQYKNTSMRFIKDYLQGAKFLIKQKDIIDLQVPHYPELKIENILNQIKNDNNILRHLNYYQDEKKLPERDFFFKVVGTIAPQYLQNLIQGQNRLRNQSEINYQQQQAIAIKDEIYEAIQQEPFFSSNIQNKFKLQFVEHKGRGTTLLKVQSKSKRQMTKKRKQFDLQVNYKVEENQNMQQQFDDNTSLEMRDSAKKFQFNI